MLKKILNQNINVVGNSQSLFDHEYGDLIDKNPTIRFNTLKDLNQKHQGTRWDYLASSNIKTIDYYNQTTPKFHTFLFTMYQDWHIKNLEEINFETNLYTLPFNFTKELHTILNNKFPSTGVTVLHFLNNIGHKNITIFGFDWKQTKTYYNRKDKRNDPHDYNLEKNYALSLIKKNKWTIIK